MIPVKKIKQLIKQHSSLGVEFVWVIIAQLLSLIGGLITIKLLSNILSKQDFGIYALLFAVVSLLAAVLYTPLGQINMRFMVLAQQEGSIKRLKTEQKNLLLLISFLSLLILIPATLILREHTNSALQTYMALALLGLAMGIQTSQQFQLMAFRLRAQASAAQMIGAIARPLSVFIVITLVGSSAISATYGLAIGFIILALSQSFFLQRSWKLAIKSTNEQSPKTTASALNYKSYFSYGFLHVLVGLVTIIILTADRWILSFWGTLEQVAIYAALMQVALAPTAFAFGILNRLAGPIFFKSHTSSKNEQNRQFRIVFIFWIIMCTIILSATWLFHYQIVQIITNSSYATYSYLLPLMVLGLLLERTAQLLEMKGSMMLKTNIYIYPRLLVIILVPIFEFLFLYYLGFEWLAVGLVCATTISLLSIALTNKIKLK